MTVMRFLYFKDQPTLKATVRGVLRKRTSLGVTFTYARAAPADMASALGDPMKHLPDNTRGALLMMMSMAAFASNDAIIKGLVSHINLYQVLFLRGSLTIVLVFAVLTRLTGPISFRIPKKDAAVLTLRSAAEVSASIGIVTALTLMPFANLGAILQSTPLVLALSAAVVFGYPIGWRRLAAILIGFCGVMLIAKPGPEGFADGTLWALLGVASVTVRDLAVRAMSPAVSTTTTTLCATTSVTVVMGVLSLGVTWDPVSFVDGFWLVANAITITIAFSLAVMVMKVGDISFVASFRYSGLLWTILLGLFIFGEVPDGWTLIGGAIIAATGIYTLMREARVAKAKAAKGQ